jgi:hypothetical protein
VVRSTACGDDDFVDVDGFADAWISSGLFVFGVDDDFGGSDLKFSIFDLSSLFAVCLFLILHDISIILFNKNTNINETINANNGFFEIKHTTKNIYTNLNKSLLNMLATFADILGGTKTKYNNDNNNISLVMLFFCRILLSKNVFNDDIYIKYYKKIIYFYIKLKIK